MQPPITATAHQLHGLHDEFNFADTAFAEFQMMLEVPARHLANDQLLHVAQRLEYAKVQIAPVDEGTNEFFVGWTISVGADDGARLDPGIAFPVAAMLLQVILERGQTHDQRPAFAEGPQPHIDAKYKAFRIARVEQADEFPAEAIEVFLIVDHPWPARLTGRGRQKNQIDIRGKIELAAAQFPHS